MLWVVREVMQLECGLWQRACHDMLRLSAANSGVPLLRWSAALTTRRSAPTQVFQRQAIHERASMAPFALCPCDHVMRIESGPRQY
jgi:hypothetical protein